MLEVGLNIYFNSLRHVIQDKKAGLRVIIWTKKHPKTSQNTQVPTWNEVVE